MTGCRRGGSFLALSTAFLFACNAFGALTATITGFTQTQALLEEAGFSGACTVLVSTSQSMTPLHPDLNGAEYPGAATDTGRADTIQSADGSTRIVTIGHMTDDRALAAFTTYYFQVSGCGGTVTGSFTTANLSTGTTRTEATPFNAAKWGNLGLPAFNWTQKQSYVDPMTGATLIPMALSTTTWRQGCDGSGCSPSSTAFANWAGGAGWSNPSTVSQGLSSTAATSNTNPLDLYTDSSIYNVGPYDWHDVGEDIGIVVWGGATSQAQADRIIDLCIFLNPSAGCASKVIQVTLPAGTPTHVTSGSSDADGAFPAAFPSRPYFGWTGSTTPLIHIENGETFGTATVSGHNLTIVGNISSAQNFSSAIAAGQKIFVAGSSGCVNNGCTAAGPPTSPSTITLVETPGDGQAAFRAYGWGVRVWKDNANGTATIGLQFKSAGSIAPLGVQAGGDGCSSVQVTSGDGKQGYMCSLTSITAGLGYLAFIATDGTTRILSSRTNISFDGTQGNVFYAAGTNSSGGWTIYKYTYTGNYTTEFNYNYTCSSGGNCPTLNDFISTPVDLMPHSANADLDQQIEANQGVTLPPYNSSMYGPWTSAGGGVGFAGSSGHFAYFCNTYAGQGQQNSGGPGWCASIDLSQTPAKVVRLIHTLDGTGAPSARFGSLHSPDASIPNTLFLALDLVNSNNTSTLHGGPFQAKAVSLLMADGSWSTNTCLDWPPGGGSICPNQNYNRACPAGSSPYTECVTLRLPQNGVCNVAPTAMEKATWPCPWNANYSQYPLMQAGDNAADLSVFGGTDSEHFRVLAVSADAGNTLRVTAARNSVYEYCSMSPWHGQPDSLSVDFAGQFQHANGWALTMMPGSANTCGGAVLLQDQTTGNIQELGRAMSNHSALGTGSAGFSDVTAVATIYNTPFSSLGQIPPSYILTPDVTFHGIGANIGSQLQSYTSAGQSAATSAWALDMNPFVACYVEIISCGITRTLTSLGGNVYQIQAAGSAAASNATYKTQPMVGWAGRYQLQDVSGPSSSVDSKPYSMCFALLAGECHAGSAANQIYVNVPVAYDPGSCVSSISWVNVPCVFFGDNAPAGGIRQFGISQSDSTGVNSRFVSNGWSSLGRHYPYSHSTLYPTGNWAMLMGTNPVDGFSLLGFMVSLPPWAVKQQPDNDFLNPIIQIPRGPMYAEIQFGYSRYIGPNRAPSNGLFCTTRTDGCNTSSATLFNFESEVRTPKVCIAGCRVTIPVVGPNVVYYRFRRSPDGINWTNSDIQAMAIP